MKGARSRRYHAYRTAVKKLTAQNRPAGSYGKTLDHIVPVSYGFAHDIPVERIASAENLVMLPFQENIAKGRSLTDDARALLSKWENDKEVTE